MLCTFGSGPPKPERPCGCLHFWYLTPFPGAIGGVVGGGESFPQSESFPPRRRSQVRIHLRDDARLAGSSPEDEGTVGTCGLYNPVLLHLVGVRLAVLSRPQVLCPRPRSSAVFGEQINDELPAVIQG